MVRAVLLSLVLSGVVHAQAYVVTFDFASFMDGAETVGTVMKNTQIYVWARQDGWLQAVNPTTLTRAWIAVADVQQKRVSDNANRRLGELQSQRVRILETVNARTSSAEDYAAKKSSS